MPISKYTKEMHLFIVKNAKGKWYSELTDMFNAHFGTDFTKNQIKAYCSNHKIASGMKGKGPDPAAREKARLLNDEQDAYLQSICKGSTWAIIADKMNVKFGLNLTVNQINYYMTNHHLQTGTKGQYKKGHIPANKGKKMSAEVYARCKGTMFKKGTVPPNWRPVESERLTKDGYIEIKIANHKKWVLKHRAVWEKANGPVPPNHLVIFLNGDKTDCSLENLYCIPQSVHVRMCQHNFYSNDRETTLRQIKIAELYKKKGEIKRKFNMR